MLLVDRPVVFLTTEEVAWIVVLLEGGYERAREGRVTVPDSVWSMLSDLRRAGEHHRGSVSGTSAVPQAREAAHSVTDELSTTETADVLGISCRGVTKRIAAGTLKGRKVGRQWMVASWSVAELLERKGNT